MRTFSLNGDFVVCKKISQDQLKEIDGFYLYNKETVPFFRIIEKHFSKQIDFPFEVGDTVCSASTGTVVCLDGEKTWLFKPEHVLAKILNK